jgi:hypothetical protein
MTDMLWCLQKFVRKSSKAARIGLMNRSIRYDLTVKEIASFNEERDRARYLSKSFRTMIIVNITGKFVTNAPDKPNGSAAGRATTHVRSSQLVDL